MKKVTNEWNKTLEEGQIQKKMSLRKDIEKETQT